MRWLRFEQAAEVAGALCGGQAGRVGAGGRRCVAGPANQGREAVADLEMVGRWRKFASSRVKSGNRCFELPRSQPHYAAAFREYGVDVDVLPADEAAAWLRSREGAPRRIVAHEWSMSP